MVWHDMKGMREEKCRYEGKVSVLKKSKRGEGVGGTNELQM